MKEMKMLQWKILTAKKNKSKRGTNTENKKKNGRCKYNHSNNNINCGWIKQANQKSNCQTE